jgi:uncharacterized protein (TIGR02271 family)
MLNRDFAATDIVTGAEVFGSDGAKVGTVSAVYPGYIVVEKGFFFPTDYYIPRSAIASSDDRVYLTVAKEVALTQGWDVLSADLETATASTSSGALTGSDELVGTQVAATDEELRIPVVEEELTATVRPTEAGAVRVEKRVVAEDRVLDVPVTEEQVRVERRVVDRPASAADADAFEEIVVEVPLTAEQVELQKQARVKEEIVVSKDAVQRTERVSDTVRREEVFVDEDAVIDPTAIERIEGESSHP